MTTTARQSARTGMVLLLVFFVLALASMAAGTLLLLMQAETGASVAANDGQYAYAAAMSGLERALDLLQQDPADIETWYDNPDQLRHQLAFESGGDRWCFTVYAYNPEDPTTVRYGLSDEAGRININVADEEVLLNLPGMTVDLIDALLDYRDADDEARPGGAEQDYYDQLPTPYRIKNGRFRTVEELLLVKGFDGPVVFGEDANYNERLDDGEADGQERFPPDDNDQQLNLGLRGLCTAVAYEPMVDSEGQRRVPLVGDARGIEDVDLPEETIEFIQIVLADGYEFEHPSELLEMRYELQNDVPAEDGGRGGRGGQGPPEPDGQDDQQFLYRAGEAIDSPVDAEQLATVLDRLTTRTGRRMFRQGLVNVNTAPQAVLAALPGMTMDLAERIVASRGSVAPADRATPAWLYAEGVLDAEQFKEIAPYLTGRGFQYRVKVVGYGLPSGQFRVLEAVVDLGRVEGSRSRLDYVRDLTRYGLPFALDEEEGEQ